MLRAPQGEAKSAMSAAWRPVGWSRWRSWAVAGSVTVGAVVVGRAVLVGRSAPLAAAARISTAAENAADRPQPTNQPADQALREWLRAPVVPPARNLFAAPPAPANSEQSSDFNTSFAESAAAPKSAPARADGDLQQQQQRDRDLEASRQIRLQSTVMGAGSGSEPTAVINGQTVREGDVVACGAGEAGGQLAAGAAARSEFRVLAIEARRVIVEHKGIRLEIPME